MIKYRLRSFHLTLLLTTWMFNTANVLARLWQVQEWGELRVGRGVGVGTCSTLAPHAPISVQSTLSKADTLGTKATVRFRELSALERVQLQRYKCNSAGSGPHLLSGLESVRLERVDCSIAAMIGSLCGAALLVLVSGRVIVWFV